MNIKDSKAKGQLIEAKFQVLALEKGFEISKPFGDNSKYDFILDHKGILNRVQIKSTSTMRGSEGYQIKASFGGKTAKDKYTKEHIDFLIGNIPELNVWYVIPVNEITSPGADVFPKNSNSRGKYEKFKEAWHLLK